MAASTSTSSLPYREPDIVTILVLASFLLLLNVLNHVLDRTIYCGLIGQIMLGVAFGTPGAKWLGEDLEGVLVELGYLGLILLVYEGGLSTSFPSLRANLALSSGVALTGIGLPIGLSYTLLELTSATSLQAFAAGAALCSTSLGTTFTVLGASGLISTRMGVVLSTAAMLDDVVGLVMVQVISNLGGASGSFSAVTVVRPVAVSLAFAIVVPVVAWWVVRPVTAVIDGWRTKQKQKQGANYATSVEKVVCSEAFAFAMHTALLLGMVTGSTYAGTSNLFASYLAGASISWWDSEIPHPNAHTRSQSHRSRDLTAAEGRSIGQASGGREPRRLSLTHVNTTTQTQNPSPSEKAVEHQNHKSSGAHTFETFYQPVLQRILKPFFFASIGFSIPITQMFQGTIVWKGIVYSILMFLGKLACGLWLVSIPGLSPSLFCNIWKLPRREKNSTRSQTNDRDTNKEMKSKEGSKVLQEDTPVDEFRARLVGEETKKTADHDAIQAIKQDQSSHQHPLPRPDPSNSNDESGATKPKNVDGGVTLPPLPHRSNESRKVKRTNSRSSTTANWKEQEDQPEQHKNEHPHQSRLPRKPISLYPSFIVGGAMAARGEIGFLISSLAQSNGIFDSTSGSENAGGVESESSPIFLIVTWAIMLCTIVGPVIVGSLVRRVKKLEKNATGKEKDVLGVWGVG